MIRSLLCSDRSRSRLGLVPAVLGLTLLAGCRPQPSIQEYEITQVEKATDKPVEIKERILGAIVPAGGEGGWWFFKMMGPAGPVESQRKQFNEFVDSLQFPGAEESPVWSAPSNWAEAGPSTMVVAAFDIKTDGKDLRLTVSKATGSLQANIDRWRNQVGLEPVPARELDSAFQKRTVHGRVILVVDFAGPGGGTGMGGMAPGKLPMGHPPIKAPKDSTGKE